MKPIGDYAILLKTNNLKEFLAENPHAVLLQHAAKGTFQAFRGTPKETLMRFEPELRPQAGLDEAALPIDLAYMVLPLGSIEHRRAARLLVGCQDECDVTIRDTSVSREHAWIERRDGAYYLTDNGSTVGTKVNGRRLEPDQACKLANSDQVTLGTVDTTYLDAEGFYLFTKVLLKL